MRLSSYVSSRSVKNMSEDIHVLFWCQINMLRTDTHWAQPAASGAVPHKRRIYSQQPPACDSFNASENVNYGRVYLSFVYLNFEERETMVSESES